MTEETDLEAINAHERVWQGLHDKATEVLNAFGTKDYRGRADYWIVDDDWGSDLLQLEFQNLKMLRPSIIKALQGLLVDYPEWMVTIHVQSPQENAPGMGLIIYPDEVVDELRRDFLPEEFRDVTFGAINKETVETLSERINKLMKR